MGTLDMFDSAKALNLNSEAAGRRVEKTNVYFMYLVMMTLQIGCFEVIFECLKL